MSGFVARSVALHGGFRVERPIDEVFPLFSPVGETRWVPGWEPELLHPPGTQWASGQVFRTRDRGREVVWIVAGLDPAAHEVSYHRLEPGRYVARVTVRCVAAGDAATEARVAYDYVGLSEEGNAEIAAMTPASYEARMRQWKTMIDVHLAESREP